MAMFVVKYWKYMALVAVIAGIYFYWANLTNTISTQQQTIAALNKDIATLESNTNRLKTEIEVQNEDILRMEARFDKAQEQITKLSLAESEARSEVERVKSKFRKHDLRGLTLKKPGLIEKIINKGTRRVFDDLSNLTVPTFSEETPK